MRVRTTTHKTIKTMVDLLVTNQDLVNSITAELPASLVAQVIRTELWPEAVPAAMIIHNESMKAIRAGAIIASFIREPVKGKSLLDFGCGEGHCVVEATRLGSRALGYDPKPTGTGNLLLSSDLAAVEAAGPFDIIMIYDVLDHILDDTDRIAALAAVKKCLKPGGNVYVRCHPFTSRHGLHTYYKFNRAYAQLFMSTEELAQYDPLPTVRTLTPLMTYKQWFSAAGFKIVNERLTRQNLDDFFSTLSEPLLKLMAGNNFVKDFDTLNAVLSVEFADFTLQPS